MQAILPSAGTQGTHAFCPSCSIAPLLVNDEAVREDERVTMGNESGRGSTSNMDSAVVSSGDIDMHSFNSLSLSLSSAGVTIVDTDSLVAKSSSADAK